MPAGSPVIRGGLFLSNKTAVNACSTSLYREAGYNTIKADELYMKKYHANFVVKTGKDGGLYAADLDQGIFTDGMTRDELIQNIHEAVECHFDVPSFKEVDIRITYN